MKAADRIAPQEFDPSKVDLLDSSLFAQGDPHLVWRCLRAVAPLHRQQMKDGRSFWSVTRYEDVCMVLRDHELFTSQRGTMLNILHKPDIASGKMLAATDPPRHTEMRRPLERTLVHETMQEHLPHLRNVVLEFLRPGYEGSSWDFAAAVTLLPLSFVGGMMGLPQQDWAWLARATSMAVAHEDPEYCENSADESLRLAHYELLAYFTSIIDSRKRQGIGDDLISRLMKIESGGARLSEQEVIFNCYGLLLGANVTTPQVASEIVLQLATDKELFQTWKSNPEYLASGVEEALRWSSPAAHFLRYAVKPVRMHEQVIQPGEAVAAWITSANRDERIFDNPDRFDIRRHPNRHIAFGIGPHVCVGASMARHLLRTLCSEILQRTKNIELTGPVSRLASNFIYGMKHLRVVFTPEP